MRIGFADLFDAEVPRLPISAWSRKTTLFFSAVYSRIQKQKKRSTRKFLGKLSVNFKTTIKRKKLLLLLLLPSTSFKINKIIFY